MIRIGHIFREASVLAVCASSVAGLAICNVAEAAHFKRLSVEISGTPATSVTAGSSYSFTPVTTDLLRRARTFTIQNQPSWAGFSTTTGALTGTPTSANVGQFSNIVITVSDGVTTASLASFAVQVNAAAVAATPVISGTPPTSASVGRAYNFQPTAKDPSGATLSFSVKNKPSWASFSIATGQLSGTPTTSAVGTDASIAISASNGTTSATLTPFTIVVAPVATTTTSTTTAATGSTSTTGSSATTTGSTGATTTSSSSTGSSTTGTTSTSTPVTTTATATGTFSVTVSGNHLVNGSGTAIQLRGVNVSALEGVPWSTDPWRGEAPNFAAMKAWGINVVRFPLSESNWLGLCNQTISAGVTPALYQSTIQTAVTQANAAGIYVILDLHWVAVPNACPQGQNAMADTSYSATFWGQVAAAFKSSPGVLFELFNEPQGNYPPTAADWTNYISGGLTGSQDAGIQSLLNAVRAAGASNVVLVDGLDYAATFGNNSSSETTGFTAPVDSIKPAQIAAVQHYYNGNQYETGANVLLAKNMPILVTEYGDDTSATDDSDTTSLYGWADPGGRAAQYLTAHGQDGASFPGVSYVAWTWDWGAGWYGGQGYNNWSLIQDATGTLFTPAAYSALGNNSAAPTAFATEVKSHYLCRAAGTASCK